MLFLSYPWKFHILDAPLENYKSYPYHMYHHINQLTELIDQQQI